MLRSETEYFAEGSIVADSREPAKGLMVITSGFVNVELPVDSAEADEEHRTPGGRTLLYVFSRGCVHIFLKPSTTVIRNQIKSLQRFYVIFLHNLQVCSREKKRICSKKPQAT